MSDVEQVEPEIEIVENSGCDNSGPTKSRCTNLTLRILFSTPGLILLVIIYSIMGALIFQLLEAPNIIENGVSVSKSRDECLKELWTITERLNVLYERNWTLLVHEQLRRFEGSIVAATKGGFIETMGDRFPRWSFSEALLYSLTVITTIGHGNLTPRTSEGKIVTMVYALVGVPLMLMCLSSLGGLLADALQCTYGKLCGTKNKHLPVNTHEGCQQFEEVDCNVCKYDSVNKEMQRYDKYTPVNDREDSCHLIRNSPSKSICISPHSSPRVQQKIVPNRQQQNSIMMVQTTKHQNYNENHSTTANSYYQASQNPPILTNSVGGYQCQTHHTNQNTKFHNNHHHSNMQLQSHLTNNERSNNHLVVYHTATVHGIGRSKFQPKPLPQEINMLLAECDMSCQQDSTITTNMNTTAGVNNSNKFTKMDLVVDEDDDDDNRNGCSHGTPSRIPLISSSPKRPQNQECGEMDENDDSNENINYTITQVPFTLILLILGSYICIGTVIFSFWENWSIIDGAYFCFVTLSTIGFGDLIPKKTFRGPDLQLFACCAYLLLGLVLVAMSFSLLETQLMWRCRKVAVRLKLAKG